ncbi:MAG: hypothetical protein PHO02_02615 [Candidatus Nanoarchaeia archaeon]|nr:hypothetical protein [Candidatus Nanoarchaeia archaeon]
MGLKGKLKYAALTACVFGGTAGALVGAFAGIGKALNEYHEIRHVGLNSIDATESVGLNGEIRLNWNRGGGAWLCYSEKGHVCDRKYFADNPLGENIKVICDNSSCVEAGENGFDKKLEPAKQDWAELCEEVDCKGLYAESQALKEFYGGK